MGRGSKNRTIRTSRPRFRSSIGPHRRRANVAVGTVNVAARIMGGIAHALERYLFRAHPLEIARRQREAEQRHAEMQAKADAADRAARDREFQEQQEDLRRRLEEELAAIQHRARQRSHAAAFHLAATCMIEREAPAPAPAAGSSKKRRGDSEDGWPQIRRMLVHRRRPFPRGAFSNGWKAIERPPQDAKYSWDDDAREDMHNDPRYRNFFTQPESNADFSVEPDRPDFDYDSGGPSLDL